MDYVNLNDEDLETEWTKRWLDDPARASQYEEEIPSYINYKSGRWFLILLLRAQKEGWAE